MVIPTFPPVHLADENGLLAFGGDLDVQSLLLAYSSGIFPWPDGDMPLLWFAPAERAVVDFVEFNLPARVERYLRKEYFQFTVDRDFEAVVRACAHAPRKGQDGTWITDAVVNAYIAFHHAGYAHSFETRDAEGLLVGGLYGVQIGRFFAAESMFHTTTHASKFALVQTVHYLKSRGLTWMDIQVMTPLLSQFGAKEISRTAYMRRLKTALSEN